MDFEPINIKIKDPRRLSEIAYLIDSPLFIKESTKIRQKYKITKPIGNEDIQQWVLTNIPKEKIPTMFKEITNLGTLFGYDSNYQAVFEKAVLGGIIKDIDYGNTFLVNFTKLPPFLTHQQTLAFGILITPQSDEKDVVVAFKRYKKIIKEFNSDEETYSSTDKRIDKRVKIKRDRKWYWKRIGGTTYRQIAKEAGISGEIFYTQYKDIIREAIKSYKEKLG